MFLGKKPSGIYFVEFFDSSLLKNRRVSSGTKNKTQALHFFRNFNFNQTIIPPKLQVKLSSFEEEYINTIGKNLSLDYLRSIKLSFKQLKIAVGDIPIQDINLKVAQKYLSETYCRAKKAASLYCRTLKAAFSRAQDWGYIDDNPFKKIKLPKGTKNFPKFVSEEELEKIIEQASDKKLKIFFYFGFYTGMRLSEIINIKWSSINLEEKVIHVQNTPEFVLKGKKDRVVPICQKLYLKLTVLRSEFQAIDGRFVFEKCKGIKLNKNYVSKQFKNAVRSAKIDEGIHFHSLRHSFASHLVQKGASIYVLKELLGHEDISTTQIYSHLKRESLTSAISLLD